MTYSNKLLTKKTTVSFCFSSPDGDLQPSMDDLKQPVFITKDVPHPRLTVGLLFETVHAYIMSPETHSMEQCISQLCQQKTELGRMERIIIRSEKQGAFYHIFSIECQGPTHICKFGLSVAFHPRGAECLKNDYDNINTLKHLDPKGLLPRIMPPETFTFNAATGSEEMIFMPGEWFCDFHEWHQGADGIIYLWDYRQGISTLLPEETFEVVRQAAAIICYFFDQQNFLHIHPWHHAAGDFIVKKTEEGSIFVKLTTVRDYRPVSFNGAATAPPIAALLHFFLQQSVQMRLDKIDGVGETVWFERDSVKAYTQGFFEALAELAKKNRAVVSVADFMQLLQSFTPEEWLILFRQVEDDFQNRHSEESTVVSNNIKEHAGLCYKNVQELTTK